jgi:16S rRNA (cytidine1402-2'-O)-methyltransferase
MAGGKGPGTLHLVATPIGNLEDLTFRALRTLEACDLIAAEDTRQTRKLLTHYGVSRPLVSCYEHNEARRIPAILAALREGKDVALVSDAGSPGVSDPGFRLVREAVAQDIPVTALPGPSAVILALSMSGLPTDRFTFYGFLPRRGSERKRLLDEAAQMPHTLIFFESPHRLIRALEDLLDRLGDRRVAVCRELTKRFEQVERGLLSEALAKARTRTPRGEFCIVVEGGGLEAVEPEDREALMERAARDMQHPTDLPLGEVARRVALKHGLTRREVYRLAIEQRARREQQDK